MPCWTHQPWPHNLNQTVSGKAGAVHSVIRTEGKGGVLRVDFGEKEEAFEKIGWDEFFGIFDENKLAFLYQDETKDGETSRFNKFIERE